MFIYFCCSLCLFTKQLSRLPKKEIIINQKIFSDLYVIVYFYVFLLNWNELFYEIITSTSVVFFDFLSF